MFAVDKAFAVHSSPSLMDQVVDSNTILRFLSFYFEFFSLLICSVGLYI